MKTVRLTLMLMAAMLLAACAQSRLKKAVETENSICPYDLEENVTVNKVELVDGNTAAFYIELGEDYDMFLDDDESKDVLRDGLIHWFTDGDSPFDDIVEAVIEADGYIGCAVQNSEGKKWKCEFSAYDLRQGKEENGQIFDSNDDDSSTDYDSDSDDIDDEVITDDFLEAAIEKANREMPNDLGDGLVMTNIGVTSSDLVFTIECDDDQADVTLLNTAKAEMKEAMIEMLKTDDEDIKTLGKLAANTNRGLMFKYVGVPSGNLCKVRLTPSEIRQALGL